MSPVFRSLAKPACLAAALAALAGPAAAEAMDHGRFGAIMDSVFGAGAWRMTGGYRTPARENQLRAQGAMTVRPGGVSRHSLGRPGAPGAYDLVVNNMSPFEAAERLRRAGAPFARYHPKGTHGSQGPHLHLEPFGFGAPRSGVQMASSGAKAPVVEGRTLAMVISMPRASRESAKAAERAFAQLQDRAMQADAGAQLELGRLYATGYVVSRDFEEAYSWLAAVVDNRTADPAIRAEAAATLAEVTRLLRAEQAQQSARYAELGGKGR